mgnify:CR=1 FL=1
MDKMDEEKLKRRVCEVLEMDSSVSFDDLTAEELGDLPPDFWDSLDQEETDFLAELC